MLRYVRMIAARAVATTQAAPMGPVHLDFMFREPLVPAVYQYETQERSQVGAGVTTILRGVSDEVADAVLPARRPLIIGGPNAGLLAGHAEKLADPLGAPILGDPLSEARTTPFGTDHILGAYDSFLRAPELVKELAPDLILRFGDPPTSKALAMYLQRYRDVKQIVVTNGAAWPDPDLTSHIIVPAESRAFCTGLLGALRNFHVQEPEWLAAWQRAERATLTAHEKALSASGEVTEPSAIADLAGLLPEGGAVMAGNSMPVRDIDSFWPVTTRLGFIHGSRGASGIDGVVSTALGIAARNDSPTVLVIGDLSFYHDMNGLLAARRHNLSATIVLINNDGGGIFSFLPQHEQSEDFELLFGTPHGLDFSHAGPLYGVGFQRVTTRQEYRDALKSSFEAPGVQVIEVRTDREENLKLHQRVWEAVADAVAPLVTEVLKP